MDAFVTWKFVIGKNIVVIWTLLKRNTKYLARVCCIHVHLHCSGTLLMLQTLGSESNRVRLMGSGIGTLAVIRRQAQSTLVVAMDFRESQQPVDGIDPLLLLPVTKFRHGVKVETIEVVHGTVKICESTDITEMTTTM